MFHNDRKLYLNETHNVPFQVEGGKVLLISNFHSHPGQFVVESANKEKVGMIVMGTRGLGTVRRTIMGSVSDYVVHHAHCPVVVCRK